MKKNNFVILFLLISTVTCQQLFAQGPPPPPATGVPFDGGILAFLVLALAGGVSFLRKKK